MAFLIIAKLSGELWFVLRVSFSIGYVAQYFVLETPLCDSAQ